MPFPISIRGSIAIPEDAKAASDEGIIAACVDQVAHEGCRIDSQDARSATFSGPFFRLFGWRWQFTAPLSAGSFEVTADAAGQRRVYYNFSRRRTALLGTIIVVALSIPVAAEGLARFLWWVPLFAWVWIVGVKYFISFVRAPFWVRRRVADAARVAAARVVQVRQPNDR